MRAILAIFILLVAPTAAVYGQDAAPPENERFEALARKLISPCCWRQDLLSHQSDEARQARSELRAYLSEGLTDREILDRFTAKYGERILIVPEGERAQWLFVAPWLALLIGAAAAAYFLAHYLRRPRKRAVSGPYVELNDDDFDW